MNQTQSNEGKRFAATVAVVVFAFIVAFAAAWMMIGRPGSGSGVGGSSEDDGYVEQQEKTKEEMLVEIEQRTQVVLDEEEAARKRELLESIER